MINFRIFPAIKENLPSYEIGQVYISPIDIRPKHTQHFGHSHSGFYFWRKPTNYFFEKFNNHLKQHKQPKINAILKCKINEQDLLVDGVRGSIRAVKFKVLKEVKL